MNDKYLAGGEPKRRPFNLEAAMRGEPLITRDGRRMKFVAYVPEAKEYKVIAFLHGRDEADKFTVDGRYYAGSTSNDSCRDLFMVPKPTRTVWLNFHEKNNLAIWYTSEALAKSSAGIQAIAVAVPVQIDLW